MPIATASPVPVNAGWLLPRSPHDTGSEYLGNAAEQNSFGIYNLSLSILCVRAYPDSPLSSAISLRRFP
jgi:hypothetical protein